jgi:nuclear receptor subfamily 5 group A member 3
MSASNAGHPNAGRANVSVTNINCENSLNVAGGDGGGSGGGVDLNVGAHCSQQHQQQQNNFYSKGSIRISVPKMEESDESDTELSNIEKTAKVNMRNSRAKGTVPRPMSWEGELSEPDDMMDTENSQSGTLKAVCGSNGDNNEPINATMTNKTTIQTHHSFPPEVKPVILQETVKTEAGHYPVESHQAIHYPNLVSATNKKYPSEVMNLKYEPGLLPEQAINSPLLMRSKTTMLPANPSPDSAIHSVYTHSSPSQSPLTSRHAPYTPSLSRNNSDASHSSCYSYSSEFSPTHSPIQGRHPMYSTNSFNGSPLHHSIYRPPIMDGSEGMLRLQTGDDPLLNEGGEHIPSAGISRQQLINR